MTFGMFRGHEHSAVVIFPMFFDMFEARTIMMPLADSSEGLAPERRRRRLACINSCTFPADFAPFKCSPNIQCEPGVYKRTIAWCGSENLFSVTDVPSVVVKEAIAGLL